MNKKKVAIIYSGGRGSGGIETYLRLLFSRFDEDDMELILFSLGKWPLTEDILQFTDKVKVFSGSRASIGAVVALAKELISGGYALVVSNGTVSNAYARAASLFSGVPSLVTTHSDLSFDYSNPVTRGIYRAIDRVTRFETKRYIAVSRFIAERLQKSGVAGSKIDTVYNAIEFPKQNINAKKPNSREIIISSLGRLHYVKGFHNLIQAMTLIHDKDVTLLIGGEGAEREELEEVIAREGLDDRVKLVGHVEDPFRFISESDIYVQSSLVEGFGLSVIEAMSVGVPVVVTPAGSLNEIVEDGITGVIANDQTPQAIAAAISTLMASSDLRKEIAKNAREYALTTFTLDKWLSGTANAYRKAMK